jgi:hypothetical protein
MVETRRIAIETRLPSVDGKIVRNLLKLHPTDAVVRATACRRADVVLRLRSALQRLDEAQWASKKR